MTLCCLEKEIWRGQSKFSSNNMFAMPTVDGLVLHLMSFSTTLVLVLVLEALWDILICCCAVKSGSTPVRGPVKSGRKRTVGRGQRFGQRLAQAGVATDWIQ